MSEPTPTADKVLKRLRNLEKSGDPEDAHAQADALLCELLEALGYDEVVEAFHGIPKWYA